MKLYAGWRTPDGCEVAIIRPNQSAQRWWREFRIMWWGWPMYFTAEEMSRGGGWGYP
jgi:hypothetical protein